MQLRINSVRIVEGLVRNLKASFPSLIIRDRPIYRLTDI